MEERKKILYVDDDERTLNVVGKFLISKGYEVFTSTSPFVGPLLLEKKPNLVILDIVMPLLTGDKIADILVNQGYAVDTPILFFSGESPEKAERMASRIPNATFLAKQSGLDSLLREVRSILS
jgi:DNA-binding response OmpR family regulator